MSLDLARQHAMKSKEEIEVHLQAFLAWALDIEEWTTYIQANLSPGKAVTLPTE
jgi:hypothetical protein